MYPDQVSKLSDDGKIITTSQIHHALRDLAGISKLGEQFPLDGKKLPIFG